MPEVTVRDAVRGDAALIGEVSSAAVPYLVRSAARVAADIGEDDRLGRHRWVGLVDDRVAGTATARQVTDHAGEREVSLTVEVHPDFGSRGVGTALLLTAATAVPGATLLHSVSRDDPISMAFAVRNGFLPEGQHQVAFVDPGSVADAGAVPQGLRAVTLDALPDLGMLLETHNLAASDDRDGTRRRMTMYQLRAEWWDSPDNAPEFSFGLVAAEPSGPVLAAFTSVQIDRERGRTWSSMTATHPAYRDQGLSGWVRRRMLNALAQAGIEESWAAAEAPMLTVDTALGYRQAATSIRLRRRLPPG